MKVVKYFGLSLVCVFLAASSLCAQETETKVIDEVVAQVNDGVITLSRIKRETKNIVDSYVDQGKKRDEAQKLVDEKQGELIAGLINEELLIQKAKELGLDNSIDANVNDRFLEIMKQYKMKTLDALYTEMEKNGVNPQELRDVWRKQAVRETVLQREVQGKIYWVFTGKDLKEYYEKHKDKFTKAETVSVSEIFVGFAGRDETAVREKAKQILAQLRTGADFDKLAKENDPGALTQGKGTAEKIKISEMPDKLAAVIKGLKIGEFTEPYEADQLGMVILRIDAREQASNESVFDENSVRFAMMNERFPEEQKKYMAKLREDSYIKINDAYRPIVSPLLFADERKDKPATK